MNFATDISAIKGVGPKTAAALYTKNIRTVIDLLRFYPRNYLDVKQVAAIKNITPGLVSLRGKFGRIIERRVRRGLHITEAELLDESGAVKVVWFNQPYRKKQIDQQTSWYVVGQFEFSGGRYQITNPSVELVDSKHLPSEGVIAEYRAIKDLKKGQIEKIIFELRPLIQALPDYMPVSIQKSHRLIGLREAIEELHFPTDMEHVEKARLRIAIDELCALFYASSLNRDEVSRQEAPSIQFDAARAKLFTKNLPFALTDAQRSTVWSIVQDIAKPHPMNRLLQGDVGSGKTAVAAMVAVLAAEQGYQTAIMAPTELLARQHAQTFEELLAPHHMTTGLLVGSMSAKQKQQIKQESAAGSLSVLVGTHALIEDDVAFHRLGMVVIDEQHRFGVQQRQKLIQKGKLAPHMLAMTATPIPRSLQLTLYGELDVSILNELPKGRVPITTKIVSPNSLDQVYKDIDDQIGKGRQAYVICRSIDESSESKSVAEEVKLLRRSILSKRKIAALHGKMPAQEKQTIMESFLAGDIDVLVSTTVVEVGVNVPNATVMLINEAEMFGLAQLHQLRGRVGRSLHQSFCYLATSTSLKPSRRLREMERSQDGFYLAQVDLDTRGPGEIYGKAQSGQLDLRMANIGSASQRAIALSIVGELRQTGFELEKHPHFYESVERFRRVTTLN